MLKAAAVGEDSRGLLDDHSTVQRGLQLLGEHITAADGAFLQDPDRGDIGQCLAYYQVGFGQDTRLVVE